MTMRNVNLRVIWVRTDLLTEKNECCVFPFPNNLQGEQTGKV